jgi:beta-ureidopropionase / N-carbamoyl-L-amino-acid hydrolase
MTGGTAGLRDRLDQAFAELAAIGTRPDGGFDRFAWTAEDQALRHWFAAQAGARDMAVETDGNGNQWAWWDSRPSRSAAPSSPERGAVVTGSHLDSVPGGGPFDGVLGVVSAFLAVDELRRQGACPARPIGVVCFADEEGARFGVACAGSRLLCGTLTPGTARALTDADGVTLAEAMRRFGADPEALGADQARLARIGVFVELHVEQGRALDQLGTPVGVATGIWPHGRWRLRLRGEGNHAGTTALADRRDPMLPLAAAVLAARDAAARAGAHATVGRVEVCPGGVNAVASQVDAWLDVRAADEVAVEKVVAEVAGVARREGGRHQVSVSVDEQSRTPPVVFAGDLRERVSRALGAVPLLDDAPIPGGVPQLATGAGHDAGILAAKVPAAMLFVRNPTGVSHSPAEHADPDACVAGVRALAAVLADLAGAP